VLNKMHGYDAPIKHDVEVSGTVDLDFKNMTDEKILQLIVKG